MFDSVSSFTFMLIVGCVREKASVQPRIPYDAVMHAAVKVDVFEFIRRVYTNNGIVFCELLQDWFDFLQCTIPRCNM